MHQYRKKGGVYVNEVAEAKGKNMAAELEKVKEQLASSAPNDTPPYQIMVPEKLQLGILSAELGVGKDKKIRGVGSSLRVQGTSCRISESNATNTSYDSKHKVDELSGKVDELLGVIRKMQAHIKYLRKKGKKNHDNDDDGDDDGDDDDGDDDGDDDDGDDDDRDLKPQPSIL
ncbi:skeletal aspartic acid-rich protein 2-like [Prunus avium]|uniref:Skeletal aspartic acid-rich protein 2-like n=1 Tax=Prunus avium TaxID=42229 RepID=A0A6P5U564_PRUAV|nr:skeletal aspartic acid-rich protein 2-like [Prunus avium]